MPQTQKKTHLPHSHLFYCSCQGCGLAVQCVSAFSVKLMVTVIALPSVSEKTFKLSNTSNLTKGVSEDLAFSVRSS